MDLNAFPAAILSEVLPYLKNGPEGLASGNDPKEIADLELSLHRRSDQGYSLETRFLAPGSRSEVRLGADRPIEIEINQVRLRELTLAYDWRAYGQALSAALFGPAEARLAYGQAVSRAGNGALRLRLLIGPSAPELQRLWWETLADPLDGGLLAANQKILFSRYLASGQRETQARTRARVKALVAVANPAGLDEYGLAVVDVAGELQRASAAMKGIRQERLATGFEPVSLAGLVRKLQDGFDILYLAAHGAFVKGESWLWLEDEQGRVARVSGAELARQVGALSQPPLLAVLASCESAGHGAGDALQALGPLLSEAGVPAVIAMQGKVAIQALERGMPVFFERLLQDGQVDLALAAARAVLAAAGDPDVWMPALFMRLRDGKLWRSEARQAPEPLLNIWQIIQDRFSDRPAAASALEDLSEQADDPDNQEAFRIQLKKMLREDPEFNARLQRTFEVLHPPGSTPTSGVNISVGGNVGGNIVVGDGNTVVK